MLLVVLAMLACETHAHENATTDTLTRHSLQAQQRDKSQTFDARVPEIAWMHEANSSVQETDDEVPSCNLFVFFPSFPSVWRSGLFCG